MRFFFLLLKDEPLLLQRELVSNTVAEHIWTSRCWKIVKLVSLGKPVDWCVMWHHEFSLWIWLQRPLMTRVTWIVAALEHYLIVEMQWMCSRTHFLPINRLCSGRSILRSVCFFMTFESWFHYRHSRLRFLQFLGQEREGCPLPIFLASLWSLRPTRQQGAGKQFYQKKQENHDKVELIQDRDRIKIHHRSRLVRRNFWLVLWSRALARSTTKLGLRSVQKKKDGETRQCI